MAQITINVPDAIAPRVLDAWASMNNWIDQPTSGTKAQFIKRCIIDIIKNTVKQYEAKVAADTARANAEGQVDQDIVLT